MPRIEIELTSSRPDGTWTWRAAGARQPKGALDGTLLSTGAKVGDVLRADTEQGMDGIRVTAVLPPKTKRPEPERLALLGPPEREPAPPGENRDERRSGPRPGGRDRESQPSAGRERGPRPAGREAPSGNREPSTARPGARDRGRKGPSGPTERERQGPGPSGPPERERQGRSGPPERERQGPSGPPERERQGPSGPPEREGQRGASRGRERRPDRPGVAAQGRESAPARPRPKRLSPGRVHRDALLAELAPEQRPVAEQVVRGGIPAVRQAVDEHNAQARAAGQPEIKADSLLAMAEELVPRLRAAEWRDRAEAAIADVETVSLRDLRAIVAGSDAAARDEASRALAAGLREAVDRRSAAERDQWLDEIRRSLQEGRVVRALRVSGRPPEPGLRFPADLGQELGAAAGAAMTSEVAPDRWAAVLDAVVSSPIRLSVRPEGLPAEPGEALTSAVRRAAARVPSLRGLVGDARPPRPPARRPSSAASGDRPVPPPPPRPTPAPSEAPGEPSPPTSGDDRKDSVLVQELGQPVDQP